MNIYPRPHGWWTDDAVWFLTNWKRIYHLTCMFMDAEE